MRILDTMLRVGDLDKSIDFQDNRLGINLLRKKRIALSGNSPQHLLAMIQKKKTH